MRWLDRLIGKVPARIPAGCRAAVVLQDGFWHVAALDANDRPVKRLSPSFEGQAFAYRYAEWARGEGPRPEYPAGVA